jgi:hypothetical protein
MAMSNPCFEIWLILHLKDINEFDEGEKAKIRINAKESNSKNYIDIVLSNLQGRGYNKVPNTSVLFPHLQQAINRAKALDSANEAYPKDLGTHVYKLLEKLIRT